MSAPLNDLPSADQDIVADNIHLAQALQYAYLFERMRVFQVVERIVELYQQGMLPLGAGAAVEHWRRYARTGDRLTDDERATFYARVLGVPGGDGEAEPNREFHSLWLRFVASVALYARQRSVEGLLAPPTPVNASIRDAARALAANTSLHGWGMAVFAARLQADVHALQALLGDPEITQAFGARDMWQVIDCVNANELGGAVNVSRYRTRAQAGHTILGWLAANADALRKPHAVPVDTSPSDGDLVQAVEQWVAVSGVQDNDVEPLSQPNESPAMTSTPIDLPAIVRDLLTAAGLSEANDRDAAPPLPAGAVLFHGPTGSGKTFAAHALAAALGLAIYRVDLARVVSKYIDETEQNLDRIFTEAERSNSILYLDEADALFGRRTDVRDAHDRYANLDAGHLLQRIEAYAGLVILAGNQRLHNDDAFADERWRRLLCRVIRFPRPKPR